MTNETKTCEPKKSVKDLLNKAGLIADKETMTFKPQSLKCEHGISGYCHTCYNKDLKKRVPTLKGLGILETII